ncbi:transmembrane sensor [Parabacteroides sp. PFB2-12]|uniref:FecR family protein n=1 Tax=unclassified Parabacteroides TaxID=2649774 RepID=UPI002475AE2E|nr:MULTISPECIES: FecR family protein [unclassified Parabacteroides]MDH6343879.1 transmembrane sensor [Parabacteroides sp. PM6-13]MDH6391241.1 transmembrane sensor [Parabacteroides sp. PFB2-12]
MDPNKIQQYIEGKASQEEREDIARWIDRDEKNHEEFRLLRNLYDATLWNDTEAPAAKLPTHKRGLSIVRELLKVAAVFLIAFGLYTWLLPVRKTAEEESLAMKSLYVPEGQRAEITLTDGTHVWLNAQTHLSFPERFTGDTRQVVLDGEAYFDVTPNKEKAFIVHTNQYDVTVLGTEFNVKAYTHTGYFETSLIEGSVEVSSSATKESLLLTPDTRAYTQDGRLEQAHNLNHDLFLWREGIIAFENELVKDLFKQLELYYDIEIEVRNTSILNYLYTGKFRTKDGVEHVLRVLQLRHKFTYEKDSDANKIIIY